MRKRLQAQYHWVIFLAALAEMTVFGGFFNNLNGLYLIPVTEAFGISRAAYALVLSLRGLTALASTALSGSLLQRFGYRKMILGSLILEACGSVLLALAPGLSVYGLGMALIGCGDGTCFTAGVAWLIGQWFHRRHGAALGIVTAFTGIGGSAFCVFYDRIMQKSGFRASYAAAAVLLAVLGLVLFLVVRDKPEQLGLRPYGAEAREPGREAAPSRTGFSLKELLRKPTFYLLAAATFLSCLILYFLFYSLVPHMRDQGLTATQAALVQSAMLLIMAAAKFVSGVLCDRIGAKKTTVLCLISTSLGLWGIAGAHTVGAAILAVFFFSNGLPLTSLTVPLLTKELFGTRAHDEAAGLLLAMVSLGSLLANPIMNLACDALGSYSPMLRLGALAGLGILILYGLLYRLTRREQGGTHGAATQV